MPKCPNGSGLSPCVRGHLMWDPKTRSWWRSIPACAGASRMDHRESDCLEVYPRVCGGILHALSRSVHETGLSPRVRGHHCEHFSTNATPRSIPTCAGASTTRGMDDVGPAVYPHVCGGIAENLALQEPESGLSPRVRGHPKCDRPAPHGAGSIPTCAGASHAGYTKGGASCGLSPRVRGHPDFLQARALLNWVYPHVCGGIRRRGRCRRLWVGSIPTCAGASVHLE